MNPSNPKAPPPCARRRVLRAATATLAALALPPLARTALAQQPGSFPERPIKVIPFGSGGGPIDVIARIYAEKLKERWGQPVVVDPKPGASGTIAADVVAKAPADGYTVLMTLSLTHINNVMLQAKLPYDPVKDFQPLSQLATGGPMLIVRASAPYSNVQEFVAYAKKHKGITYGTWGSGSIAHLFGELLSRENDLGLIHVPYKAESVAHNNMFGESLDIAWANPSTARGLVKAGRIKVLGVTGSRRIGSMPDVPTFTEQGFKGFDLDSWIGVYAPARTPAPIVAQWTAALQEITRMPDIQERLASYGFEPLGNSPDQFLANYKSDFPRVAELIKAAGVTPQ